MVNKSELDVKRERLSRIAEDWQAAYVEYLAAIKAAQGQLVSEKKVGNCAKGGLEDCSLGV